MPVIDGDDYLQFQRNLLAESAAIYNRTSQIENRQSQERQAELGRQSSAQNLHANMAMALKRLAFDEKVQKERERYHNNNFQLQSEKFRLEKDLHNSRVQLEKTKVAQAELQARSMENQIKEFEQSQKDLVRFAQAHEALTQARLPGAEGEPADPAAIRQAGLDLLGVGVENPAAAAQFAEGLGMKGFAQMLPSDLGGLTVQDLAATVDLKVAQAAAMRASTQTKLQEGGAAGLDSEEAIRRQKWLNETQDEYVERYSTLVVPGYGRFSSKAEVRTARDDFMRVQWKEAELVNQQISAIRTAGLLRDIDIEALATKASLLGPKTQSTIENLKNEAMKADESQASARDATLRALNVLQTKVNELSGRAAGFDLVENLVGEQERVVKKTLHDVWAANLANPNWALDTLNKVEPVFSEMSNTWEGIVNDPNVMGLIESYRQNPNPNSDDWVGVATQMNRRLREQGLTDGARESVIQMIRASHPHHHNVKPSGVQ